MSEHEEETPKTPRKKASGKQSLVAKLSTIMGDIEEVPMKGYNAHHDYKYVMEPELFDAIRGKMAENHIMLIPSITGVERVIEKGLVTISMNYRLMDGDTGEVIDIPWRAEGSDASDKGINKATTAASKFLVAKMFLCVTDNGNGEAPDAENDRTEAGGSRKTVIQTDPPAQTTQANGSSGGLIQTTVEKIEHQNGTNKNGAWTRYGLTFADNRRASTFDHKLGDIAEFACQNKLSVNVSLSASGKTDKKGQPFLQVDDMSLVKPQEEPKEEKVAELTSEEIFDEAPF
jgi:hypothetical protein